MDIRPTDEKASARVPARGQHTWDEFVRLDDDDRRELIEGEFVETEVPTNLHEWIVMTLGALLWNWAMPRKAGVVLASGYKVRISPRRGVMPDVQFFRTGNPAPRQEQGVVEGHPDLVVEVVSPTSGRYDRATKLRYYQSIAVPEYWIVDPEHRTLECLVLRGKDYSVAHALEGDDVFRPESFEGLEVPLATLWNMPV